MNMNFEDVPEMKWLTTGQIIDRLKIGEIATLKEEFQIPKKVGPSFTCVTKDEDGDILWCTENKSQFDEEPLQLFGHVCNWQWRILPKYVSFEEAMKALKDGKKVSLDNATFDKSYDMEDSVGSYTFWEDLINGKWTIED